MLGCGRCTTRGAGHMGAHGSKEPPDVICCGLDAAGKTTMLYRLLQRHGDPRGAEVETTIPTIGFNVETLEGKVCGMRLFTWDVGGADKCRPLWRHFWASARGLIFVVDSSDTERIGDARRELHYLLGENFGGRRDWPVLVLANKQDLQHARSVAEVTSDLGLASLRGRQWRVWGTDMLATDMSVGSDRRFDGVDWLRTAIGAGGKPPKRNWTQLAANPETAGELLLTWASGQSERGVMQDPRDAEQALRPHLQQLALLVQEAGNQDVPVPPYLDAPVGGHVWPGYTPLQICATLGNLALGSLLLAAKAAPDNPLAAATGDGDGQTALSLAIVACGEAMVQDDSSTEDVCCDATAWVACLLKAGADPRASVPGRTEHGTDTQMPLLMLALSVRTSPTAIEALLAAGADPNAGAAAGWPEDRKLLYEGLTPLRAAILYGDDKGRAAELVALLLAHGAVTAGCEGRAALTMAIVEADRDTVALLVEHIEVRSAHLVEAASKLDGPMTARHFDGTGLEGFQLIAAHKYHQYDNRIYSLRVVVAEAEAEAAESNSEAVESECPAVEMLQLLLDASEGMDPLPAAVANAAALVAVRACSVLTLESGIFGAGKQVPAKHTMRGEGCVRVLSLLEERAKPPSAASAEGSWSLRLSCGLEVWPRFEHARDNETHVYARQGYALRSRCACLLEQELEETLEMALEDTMLWRSGEVALERLLHADTMLAEQAAAFGRRQETAVAGFAGDDVRLPYPTLLHLLIGTATFNTLESPRWRADAAQRAFTPVAQALVAAGSHPHTVWLEPTPPPRWLGMRRVPMRREVGFAELIGRKAGPTDALLPGRKVLVPALTVTMPTLVRGSAPPDCTPLALALREADGVGTLTAIILALDGALPISTCTIGKIAEDEVRLAAAAAGPLLVLGEERQGGGRRARSTRPRKPGFSWVYPEATAVEEHKADYWQAGQCTLLDELLSRSREQGHSALTQLLHAESGWCCTPLQARRTLDAMFEVIFVMSAEMPWRDIGLEQLLLADDGLEEGQQGRCGELFRWALSPHRFVSDDEGAGAAAAAAAAASASGRGGGGLSQRPVAFALEFHDFQLLRVLLRAGAVLLPSDDGRLSAMAARSDVCTCTDTTMCDAAASGQQQRCQGQMRWRGELLAECLGFRAAQRLVMARQRLSFGSILHTRLGTAGNQALTSCDDGGGGGTPGRNLRGDGGEPLEVAVVAAAAGCSSPSSAAMVVDYDVVGRVAHNVAQLRPGWLGRAAAAALLRGAR